MNFDINEKELLEEFSTTETCKSVSKLLNLLVESQERVVLNYNIADGDAKELVYLRCKADGAKKMAYDFKSYLSRLRVKSVGGVRRNKSSE